MTERVLSGRYALREIIGTGGMSIVYKAWDCQQRREVAVKVLRSEFTNDEEFVRRFTNEAHAVLQMHHPNIVDIYGLGQDEDTRYIVMEFVNGVTLKEMIRQEGPIRSRRAVQMAIRILAAVDHAHKNHIVHRDIKPQNIMVNADYIVKVTDFGIARATNSDRTPVDVPMMEQERPQAKNVLGSVHYFSPEQASGQTADEKSDLYSVGVVLYEMLTGKVPFDGDSPEDVAIKHVREMPAPPSSIKPDLSRALDLVISRALEKNPKLRYHTAAEMAADLKRALNMPDGSFFQPAQPEEEQSEPKPLQQYSRRTVLLFFSCAAVLCVMVGVLFLTRGYLRSMQSTLEIPQVTQMHIEDAAEFLKQQGIPYTI
ncbi:MAG: protein kinase, partial [Eubacteriales bacterium]|nr:protein kinase [Eubacteriales bacterium]